MARARAPPRPGERRRAIEARPAPAKLPLFPLQTVLFPGGRLPLRIFEKRYMDMARACLRDGSPFGVCLIREGSEVGEPALPVEVGTLARIAAWDMEQLGVLQVVALGERRFRILERHLEPDGLARAQVELLAEEADAPVPASCTASVRLLEQVLSGHAALFEPPYRLDSSAWVGARLAEILPLPLAEKQALLEMGDAAQRLSRLNALVAGA
ncbi:MAG: LON peptidase substrate-binding domain-containing protein [Clostridia bacterium]